MRCRYRRRGRKVLTSYRKVPIRSKGAQRSWLQIVALRSCLPFGGRIPTGEALKNKGVNIGSSCCPMCKVESETDDHILVSCPFAKEVLIWIFKCCNIPLPSASKVEELINFACFVGQLSEEKEIISHHYGFLWLIWKKSPIKPCTDRHIHVSDGILINTTFFIAVEFTVPLFRITEECHIIYVKS
ncbi:unnamed protein product [Lactuca saligna]|uniref:Reverse transcriptase zinc-binding domain-containing protein n=1 Tax=Lactuca saligna TaxID=75948 RepID=A0AA35YKU5_LACSI|nr:unnamed protein product [Lactuca saligna]